MKFIVKVISDLTCDLAPEKSFVIGSFNPKEKGKSYNQERNYT